MRKLLHTTNFLSLGKVFECYDLHPENTFKMIFYQIFILIIVKNKNIPVTS